MLAKYFIKSIKLGPKKTFCIVRDRTKNKLFDLYWRTAAQQHKASFSWNAIAKKYCYKKDFAEFLQQLQQKNFQIPSILYESIDDAKKMLDDADDFVQQRFAFLGSEKQHYTHIPWHYDFRLAQQSSEADNFFNPYTYYKDIKICSGQSDALSKDIKLPWEISRLQHLFVLGQAYYITQEEKYQQAFYQQWLDWYEKNPFLLGAHWACPMDVGIRAVNLVLTFELLKNKIHDEIFWQKYVTNLYDHLFFLEHNWEKYDYRTSNHYLSDLIGYFYLCWLFIDLPGIVEKSRWCAQELLIEFEKQVFDEGTDYEGSTYYHQLVTEIFYHWFLMCQELALPFSEQNYKKLQQMFEFIQWCTPKNGKLIQIGDNDSGKITWFGISEKLLQKTTGNENFFATTKYFPEFGISIFKTDQWHISIRHYAYQDDQPSGHFHSDIGHVTVVYDGCPIWVDPGSYVYTPSAIWRNYFRSEQMHNMFYLKNQEPIELSDTLFCLDIPEQKISADFLQQKNNHFFTQHQLYKNVTATRNIMIDETMQEVRICDSWQSDVLQESNYLTVWNFCLSPEVSVQEHPKGFLLQHAIAGSFLFTSPFLFLITDGWYSEKYGKKQATCILQAEQNLKINEKVIIILKKM